LAPYSYAVAGFALGPVLPTTMAWLAGMAPSSAQAANAAILCASMIGSIGSPPLIGAIAGDTAGSVVPISVGSAAALCAIAILVAGHVTRPKKDPVARSGVQG
jgi:MFS family permease